MTFVKEPFRTVLNEDIGYLSIVYASDIDNLQLDLCRWFLDSGEF